MRKAAYPLSLAMLFASSTIVFAADFKVYPDAILDAKASQEASQVAEGKATIYTTSEAFEKVYAFYEKAAKEYKMPQRGGVEKLPSGQELREAYFIFDGAPDISTSKLWIKIQRPYIGRVEMGRDFQVKYHDVRDVTAITVSDQR